MPKILTGGEAHSLERIAAARQGLGAEQPVKAGADVVKQPTGYATGDVVFEITGRLRGAGELPRDLVFE